MCRRELGLQGSYSLIMSTERCSKLTPLEKFSMLIAGLGHDLGHDGVNTGFHVASTSEMAMRYNDRSPLENMHAYELFDAMRQTGCDIFQVNAGAAHSMP